MIALSYLPGYSIIYPNLIQSFNINYGGSKRTENGAAVEAKAHTVHNDYLKTAREADSKWNNTPQNAVGPIESRLNEFDTVLPFVFGYLGEVNKAVRLHLSARHPTKWFHIIQYLRAIRCSFLSVWNLRRLSPHQALSLASR